MEGKEAYEALLVIFFSNCLLLPRLPPSMYDVKFYSCRGKRDLDKDQECK